MRSRRSLRVFRPSLAVALCLFTGPVAAQPAPAASPLVARPSSRLPQQPDLPRIYAAALKAYLDGDYQTAHDGFSRVWAIEKKPTTAGNLGRSELKLRRHRDAAEHLSYFLREEQDVPDVDRKEVVAMLGEARTKIGTLRVHADHPGAEIRIDGVRVGTSPVKEDLYVEPGRHTVVARLGDLGAARQITAAEGKLQTVTLELVPPVVPPPKPSVVPQVVGLAAGVAAMAAGGVLMGLAEGKRTEAKDGAPKSPQGLPVCLTRQNDHEGRYGSRCNEVRSLTGQADDLWGTGVGMLIVGGAAAVTAGALLLPRVMRSGGAHSSRVVPVVGPNSAGVVVQGSF